MCLWLSLSVLALATGAAGNGEKPVEVVQPESREVADYEDFTGRTEASATVQIKARVSGFLTRVLFKEGTAVKKGDLLFEIDPRPYQTELDKADAALALSEARLKRADAAHKRGKALFDSKAMGREELDKIAAERDEAQARLRVAKANRDHARLNLDFTRVTAPMSGRIGRRLLDVGNLVKADETDLATVISSKPMYVYFDIDERTVLRLRQGKGLQVAMALANDKGFPHRAEVDYVANGVDPTTGTLRLRATLPNADGLLMPGLFVRVRLTTSKPYKALLVPERAVGRKNEQTYVLVVTDKNKVEVRQVKVGSKHGDQMVVKEGLQAGDQVVRKGPGELKEGMVVRPKRVARPGAP
jgi:RND family efflux transporter MFP subunit